MARWVVRILGIDGSPIGSGRTLAALQVVLRAAEETGAETEVRSLAGAESDTAVLLDVIAALATADAAVVGSPVYRASYAAPLKLLLDRLPRGMWRETEAPLQGKAVAVVLTGASWHHFLAVNELRNVLAGFFAAHVVPPGLYLPREGFVSDGSAVLEPSYVERASLQGRALVELATALRASTALAQLTPQA